MKKIISILMSLTLLLSMAVPALAADSSTTEYQIVIEGITYTITESYINGKKIVDVTFGEAKTTISLDDEHLIVYSDDEITNLPVDALECNAELSGQASAQARTYAMKTSLYWDYYYYYSDSYFSTRGMYFNFECGDEGSWSGFDEKNTEARSIGYDYCTAVRALDSAQVAATAASGTSAASVAAALASLGPTAGVGAVIGVVVALVSGGVAVAEWVAAYNYSLDCNQLFLQFQQAL